jgi:hypothetical protein
MARPHIKEFEALPTHQMSRLERDSSRRMIRECSRIIKMDMDRRMSDRPKRINKDTVKFAPNPAIGPRVVATRII